MKILYLHQYFRRPDEGGAIRSYYIAKGLVDKGHQVILITSHNAPIEIVKEIEGIKVHYLPIPYQNNFGFFKRIVSFLRYVYLSYKKAASIGNIDLCFATSTPLTVGITSLLLKIKFKIPYVFEVRDLWPEAPVQLGVIQNPILKWVLYYFEKKVYQEAKKLIALSPGTFDYIHKIVPHKDIALIPNMSDCSFFQIESKSDILLENFKVKGKFVVSYIGAIGKANKLEKFLELAYTCQKEGLEDIVFLCAGAGSEKNKILHLKQGKKINNISFLGYLNKKEVKNLMNITDAIYVSFADYPVLEFTSPNKFFDGLASGKLILVNFKGWLKELVENENCGIFLNTKDPDDMILKIKSFTENRNKLETFKANARALAERKFSRKLLTEETERFIAR